MAMIDAFVNELKRQCLVSSERKPQIEAGQAMTGAIY
jgi:hypothetical protein